MESAPTQVAIAAILDEQKKIRELLERLLQFEIDKRDIQL